MTTVRTRHNSFDECAHKVTELHTLRQESLLLLGVLVQEVVVAAHDQGEGQHGAGDPQPVRGVQRQVAGAGSLVLSVHSVVVVVVALEVQEDHRGHDTEHHLKQVSSHRDKSGERGERSRRNHVKDCRHTSKEDGDH